MRNRSVPHKDATRGANEAQLEIIPEPNQDAPSSLPRGCGACYVPLERNVQTHSPGIVRSKTLGRGVLYLVKKKVYTWLARSRMCRGAIEGKNYAPKFSSAMEVCQ